MSVVLSTRVSKQTYEDFIAAIGPDTCAGDVLRNLIMDFISMKGEGAGQKLISEKEQPSEKAYPQEQAEGAIEKGLGSPEIHVDKTSHVETPAISESVKVAETPAPIEPVKVGGQQCYYHHLNPKTQLVECTRKYAKTEEIDRVTQQVCDYCWTTLDPYKKYPIPNSQITDEQISKEDAP